MSIPIKKVKTDSFSMEYFTFGKGKKAFVILPGLSVQSVMKSADIIARDYELIAREFTVYVFDRRSDLPASYSVYDMAEDTAKVFEILGIKDTYLFGASQGGMIGLTLALRYPSLVKKLMLGSSCSHITDEQYQTIEKWIAFAKENKGSQLYVEQGEDIYPEALFKQYKTILEKLGESVTQEELNRFVILAKGTKGFDVTDKLKDISCPVFAIGSTDDKVLGGATQEIIKILAEKSGFESYMYSSYGHAAFDTAPDYKERLLAFCNK